MDWPRGGTWWERLRQLSVADFCQQRTHFTTCPARSEFGMTLHATSESAAATSPPDPASIATAAAATFPSAPAGRAKRTGRCLQYSALHQTRR